MRRQRGEWTYQRRAVKFRPYLQRLQGRITTEDLLAVFQEIDDRAMHRTWQAAYQQSRRAAKAREAA
jgi:hypothetical protein